MAIISKIIKENKDKYGCFLNDLYDKERELKNHFKYGTYVKDAIDQNSVLIWIDSYDEALSAEMHEVIDYKKTHVDAKVFINNSELKETLRNLIDPSLTVSNEDMYKLLAISGTIVCFGDLPDYYTYRENQKVISYYHSTLYSQEDRRLNNAKSTIVSFLKSTFIVVQNERARKELLEDFQLANLYEGEIVLGKDFNLEDVVMRNHLQMTEKANQKKKLLIIHDWNASEFMDQLVYLLSNIIYEDTDVTLLMHREPNNIMRKKLLKIIPENVRVIFRRSTFSCFPDDYVKTQMYINCCSNYDDFKELTDEMDMTIFKNEVYRVIGNVSFDSIVNVSRESHLWNFLISQMKAKTKLCFLSGELLPENYKDLESTAKNKVDNLVISISKTFDQIIITSKMNEATKNVMSDKQVKLYCPNITINEHSRNDLQTIQYQGHNYYMKNNYSVNVHLDYTMIQIPDSNVTNYIANSDISNMEEIISFFDLNFGENCELYCFGAADDLLQQYVDDFDCKYRVHLIETMHFINLNIFEEYSKHFSNYLTTEKDEKDPIRDICELNGIKTKWINDGKGELLPLMNRFSVQEYNAYYREQIKDLLNLK